MNYIFPHEVYDKMSLSESQLWTKYI